MDRVTANQYKQTFQDTFVGGYELGEVLGNGKSAIVFRAKDNPGAVVKIFERELVERFGQDAQQERINREKTLVGHEHPHLVTILDAGYDKEREVFFTVMEYFDGPNLKDALQTIPSERVPGIIKEVASAAEFLETLGLAHRDIKPENIGISSDFSKVVLFDLGVLRPISNEKNVTDIGDDRSAFVGTLRYSSPEFLHRKEVDTKEGWRAVSFYQLGGVLHDLLVRKELFCGFDTPFATLVSSIDSRAVDFPDDCPTELRMLAKDCLTKDPAMRLRLVSWDRFKRIGERQPTKERLRERAQRIALQVPAFHPPASDSEAVLANARRIIDRAIRSASKSGRLPRFLISSQPIRISFAFGGESSAVWAVYFDVMVLKDSVVALTCAARAAAAEKDLPIALPAEDFSQIFLGVLDEHALVSVIESRLLSVYLNVSEHTSVATTLSKPGTIVRIDTTEDES